MWFNTCYGQTSKNLSSENSFYHNGLEKASSTLFYLPYKSAFLSKAPTETLYIIGPFIRGKIGPVLHTDGVLNKRQTIPYKRNISFEI